MIESYSFGKIVIDGKEYSRDVIVYPDHVEPNWWRKRGHELCVEDIKSRIEKAAPDILVLGTGAYGNVIILDSTRKFLEQRNIKLIAENTGSACTTFNELMKSNKKVLGAFHLTC
ncbi:MAG: Mth938-like domain-containing protein [bacterium]